MPISQRPTVTIASSTKNGRATRANSCIMRFSFSAYRRSRPAEPVPALRPPDRGRMPDVVEYAPGGRRRRRAQVPAGGPAMPRRRAAAPRPLAPAQRAGRSPRARPDAAAGGAVRPPANRRSSPPLDARGSELVRWQGRAPAASSRALEPASVNCRFSRVTRSGPMKTLRTTAEATRAARVVAQGDHLARGDRQRREDARAGPAEVLGDGALLPPPPLARWTLRLTNTVMPLVAPALPGGGRARRPRSPGSR